MTKSFKERYTFEDRKAESDRIKKIYPNRIPIIAEVKDKNLPPLDKCKYLVPCDLNIGQFVYVIRKRIQLSSEDAIFLFVKNEVPATAQLIAELYKQHREDDGFLYLKVYGEKAFGSLN